MKTYKVGLTGATGVLGQALQKHWENTEWFCFSGRIERPDDLQKWLEQVPKLDALIHCAAVVPIKEVEANLVQAIKVNVEGTCNLFNALGGRSDQDAHSPPWIFVASTSHVYASSALALSEESALAPITQYGLTKLQAEQWAQCLAKRYQLNLCLGRIFSYSSPLQARTYFIPAMIDKITYAPPNVTLEVPGLNGTRDFLSSQHIAKTIERLFLCRANGIYNIALGRPIKLLDVANTIKHRLKREDVQIVALEEGTSHLVASTDKLNGLGITPESGLDDVLKDLGL